MGTFLLEDLAKVLLLGIHYTRFHGEIIKTYFVDTYTYLELRYLGLCLLRSVRLNTYRPNSGMSVQHIGFIRY